MGHGQVAGAHGELDVLLGLAQPFQESHTGFHLGVGRIGHGHACALLDGNGGAVRKLRAGQHFHLNVVALGVAGHHLLGEEGGAGAGAHIGEDVARLDVVAAEAARGGKPALDEGHIVVVPQLAGGLLAQAHGHFALLHVKDGVAQLFCPDEQVVCHGVAAKQGLAVVGGSRLGVGPLVVFLGRLHQPFHGGKIIVAGPGGLGKGLPIGVVQQQQLGGFRHREDLHAAIVVKIALGEVVVDIGRFLFVRQVAAQIGQQAHLIHGVAGVRIGGEDVGQVGSAHLALGGGQHIGFQIVHAALTVGIHRDVLFFAHGGVELFHQLVEGLQLVAVVVRPYRDGHGLGVRGLFGAGSRFRAAAGGQAQGQGGGTKGRANAFEAVFHSFLLSFSSLTACSAGGPVRCPSRPSPFRSAGRGWRRRWPSPWPSWRRRAFPPARSLRRALRPSCGCTSGPARR